MRLQRVLSLALVLTLAAAGLVTLAAQEPTDQEERLQDSVKVLNDLSRGPDERIPQGLLSRAEAVIVVPSLIKGGFVIGGKHGKGVVSVRDSATGNWSAPAFVKLSGGSIGWQIGVESIDLVLLVMNREGITKLLDDKFTIGGNLSVSAGPLGRSGDAATDVQVSAQILAYSRSKGLFAGATFEGSALHADDTDNEDLYGERITLEYL
jgi:lipid-binding SYLF domain-containing protein